MLLIHSKNFCTEVNTNTNPLKEPWFNKTKKRMYNIWFNEIHLIQFVVTKTQFFVWYAVRNMIRHDENSFFVIDLASYLIAIVLHDCIPYNINMILLWWMGVAKVRYQFINSSGDSLSMVTAWFVSNIDNTSSTWI